MHRAFGLLPALQNHLDLAWGNRVPDDELRQVRDPEPSEERWHQSLAIVDAQRPSRAYARLLAGGIGVVPNAGRGEIRVTETFMLGEMHRMRRPAVALEIS